MLFEVANRIQYVIQQLLDTKVNKFIFGATTRSRNSNKNKAIITQAEATCVVELSQKTLPKMVKGINKLQIAFEI